MQNFPWGRRLALAALICCGLAVRPGAATEWPRSDVAADPAVRLGVLPDGMRYVLMKNQTPAGAVSVRFSLDVGSTDEDPDQRGFSHFVEHMAFRGSKNFPDGELNRTLERLGLRFGADTNASTGQYRTEYRFDLPAADPRSLSDVLAITRDIAGNLTLDARAVDTEAGVVMSEAGLRGNPSRHSALSQMQFELVDARASATPGSEPTIVEHPAAADLRRFYRAWYRPERAILTIVGDIDPDQLAAQISARFSDWNGAGEAGRDPVFKVPFDRGLAARLFAEEGAPTQLVLAWVRPPLRHPVDRAGWRQQHVDGVALQIVNRRLAAMAASAEHPFVNARAGRRDALGAAYILSLAAGFDGGDWSKALAALVRTRLALLRDSVSQAEIDSVVAAQTAAGQRQEDAADTRTSPALADDLSSTTIDGDIPVSPAQARAARDADIAGLTPDRVGQALREMFGGGDPLIFVSSRNPVKADAAAVMEAYRRASAETGPLAAVAEPATWPYTDFGAPGAVVATSNLPDIGVTALTFANNVHLLVRPSRLRVNQVLVSVKFGDGRLGLPKDRAVADWIFGAVVPGGLGALSSTDIVTALSGRGYGTGLNVGDSGFALVGQTTPQDLQTQLQLFAAYLNDPGFRPEAFEQFRQQSIGHLRSADATPSGVMGMKSAEILHGGDKRWANPSLADIRGADIGDLKSLAGPAFAASPIEVVITGDTTVEAASHAVSLTLGALAPRTARPPPVTPDNDVAFASATPAPVVLRPTAPSPQTIASISWPTRGLFADLKADAALRLLSALMREKLLDDVRARGLSYSVQVGAATSSVFDFGYLSATATMPAGKAQIFYDAVDRIAAELKEGRIGADEFERSRTPTLQALRKSVQTNGYWQGLLVSSWDDAAKFDRARNFEKVLEKVTPEDVAAAARKYLAGDRAVKIVAGS